MKTTIRLISALFALSAFILLGNGCSTTSTGTQKVVARLAVQYAVLKVAEKNPAKAARIADIAREVRALAGTDGANTVDLLVALIKTKVAWSNLTPADAMLARALIDTIGEQLRERVGGGTLGTDQLPLVAEVAGWVIESASALPPTVGTPPPSA